MVQVLPFITIIVWPAHLICEIHWPKLSPGSSLGETAQAVQLFVLYLLQTLQRSQNSKPHHTAVTNPEKKEQNLLSPSVSSSLSEYNTAFSSFPFTCSSRPQG